MTLAIDSDTFGRFERLSFVSRRRARAGLGGEHRSRRRAPSTDFVDYRPYQPGDDFRSVDWNIYGRLGSLQVKVTEGRETQDVILVLDCSSSMACGKPDKLTCGAQLVAALGYVGMARADAVRIVCLTAAASRRGFGPFGRRARMPELVRQLAQIAPAGALDINVGMSAALADLTSAARQPLVVVVSDLLSPAGAAAGLEALQANQADVVVLHVVSPDELNPSWSGEAELVDAETGEVLDIGISLDTLAAYRARFAAWLADREAECVTRGIRYARIRTDRPVATIMLDDLRQARVLK